MEKRNEWGLLILVVLITIILLALVFKIDKMQEEIDTLRNDTIETFRDHERLMVDNWNDRNDLMQIDYRKSEVRDYRIINTLYNRTNRTNITPEEWMELTNYE